MAANTLGIAFEDLQASVAMELGWDRTVASWSTQQDLDFNIIMEDGLRQFYSPPVLPGEHTTHDWSFLYPIAQLDLVTEFSDSTITVTTNGVNLAILASGTWPSWANQGTLFYTDDAGVKQSIEATSGASSSTLVLPDDDNAVAAAETTFSLKRVYYDLPDDFSSLPSDTFNYRRDEQVHLPETIKVVGEADLRTIDREVINYRYPRYASITWVAPDDATPQGMRARVRFFPLTDNVYYLDYRYRANPVTLSAGLYPYGGVQHADTIMASVIDKTYQRLRDSYEHHNVFLERLHSSVRMDRRHAAPQTLGFGPSTHSRGFGTSLRDARRHTPYGNITTSF